MTEQEAKTKWCPFARVSAVFRYSHEENRTNEFAVAYNRSATDSPVTARCIGSACMAWRWEVKLKVINSPADESGYCGIAGKPNG